MIEIEKISRNFGGTVFPEYFSVYSEFVSICLWISGCACWRALTWTKGESFLPLGSRFWTLMAFPQSSPFKFPNNIMYLCCLSLWIQGKICWAAESLKTNLRLSPTLHIFIKGKGSLSSQVMHKKEMNHLSQI